MLFEGEGGLDEGEVGGEEERFWFGGVRVTVGVFEEKAEGGMVVQLRVFGGAVVSTLCGASLWFVILVN